jgi:hypothetical protein
MESDWRTQGEDNTQSHNSATDDVGKNYIPGISEWPGSQREYPFVEAEYRRLEGQMGEIVRYEHAENHLDGKVQQLVGCEIQKQGGMTCVFLIIFGIPTFML